MFLQKGKCVTSSSRMSGKKTTKCQEWISCLSKGVNLGKPFSVGLMLVFKLFNIEHLY